MTTEKPKIVVVTPVKNEAWILDRFLTVSSRFADVIVIADQCSTDESVEICARHPKVVVIENRSAEFNEAERQRMLLQKARELVPEPRIILALDADEVLAADAMTAAGWRTMLEAKPGTVLCFEKPELFARPDLCVRHNVPWPIGYVDDGAEQTPRKIHSIRIPMPDYAPRLYINDVKFLHYSLLRPDAQMSKQRMYSVLENIQGTAPVRRRRLRYAADFDFSTVGSLEPTPPEWFAGWEKLGIDMRTALCFRYNWQDFEVLRQLNKYGTRRFWPDDIWQYDWESLRQYALSQQIDYAPTSPIVGPPLWYRLGLKVMDALVAGSRAVMRRFGVLNDGRWK